MYILSRISGEGSDRQAVPGDILLTETEKRDVLALNRSYEKFLLVLNVGGVVDLSPVMEVRNVLLLSQLGVETGNILADLLLGRSVPSGKLATTWTAWEDYPTLGEFGARDDTRYREGVYVGYRWFDTVGKKPLFPFGFGLSYTTFAYSDITATDKEVRFTLTNTGSVDGAEVAQVYVHAQNPTVYRPAKELKGFQKVFLKAGESKTVSIPLDDKAFRYWNDVTGRFEIDGGAYDIMVGASVADIRLSTEVTVKGTDAPACEDLAKLPSYVSGEIRAVSDAEFRELLGHEIPDGKWAGTIQANDAIAQLYYAKSLKARLVWKVMDGMLQKSIEKGEPDLNITFIYNMPIRAIGKMAGGMVSQDMCDGILDIINGHGISFCKGLGKVIGGFFRQQGVAKQQKALE